MDAPKKYVEVRFGRDQKMYTLWSIVSSNTIASEHYIRNLSTNYDEAVEKAEKFSKRIGAELCIDAPDSLKPIVRGEDVLRFGKYKDNHLTDINDDKYMLWLSKGAQIKKYTNKGEGYWSSMLNHDDNIRMLAEEILLEKGFLVIYNDKVVTSEYADKLKMQNELNLLSEFVGTIGDKITIKATVENSTYYEGSYGVVHIYTFRGEDNNIYVYKGNLLSFPVIYKDTFTEQLYNCSDKIFKNLIHVGINDGRLHTIHDSYNCTSEQRNFIDSLNFSNIETANYINIKTGDILNLERISEDYFVKKTDECILTGTLKDHTIYKETKQNILQRVKISK